MKILVAEDEAVSRELLISLFTKWGYDVVPVSDGTEAWRLIQEQDDLRIAILDWTMPGKDGVTLCKLIRDKLKEGGYIYIMIMTATDNNEEALACLEAGADDYIAKPFRTEDLFSRVRLGKRILDLERCMQDIYLELKRMASFDDLTEVWNRRLVLEQLEKEWDRAIREGKALSVVLVDIDHFEQFKDNNGLAVGHRALIHLSRLLRETVRPYDGIGRYRGEAFLLFFPECDEREGYVITERLRKELERTPVREQNRPLKITASFGGTTFLPDHCHCNATHLLKVADDALYEAKRNGRNRVAWLQIAEDNSCNTVS
jgi:two-component system, cell cycle response regulator